MDGLQLELDAVKRSIEELRYDLKNIEEEVVCIDDARNDLQTLREEVDVIREGRVSADTLLSSEEVSDVKKIIEWFTRRCNKDRVIKRTVRKEKFKQVIEKVELLAMDVARLHRSDTTCLEQKQEQQEQTPTEEGSSEACNFCSLK